MQAFDLSKQKSATDYYKEFIEHLKLRNANEPEFIQAVTEFAEIIIPFMFENPKYLQAKILERMVEPERVIMFRVCWEDDLGQVQTNRGYRVQFNNAIGPYKGGLRFHPSVNLSVMKFLGFEQIFKNSLTTLPIGGGKGGSDFDPKGKSDREIMRFCQSYMTELYRHIGPDTDVPAGDIGVGAREISYLFGQYKRIANEFTGTMTGKGLEFGGSHIRAEATGYGLVYFAQNVLNHSKDSLKDKNCLISGSGNVAQYAAEKIMELGGKVVSLSDSKGTIHFKNGLTKEQLAEVRELKLKRGRLSELNFEGAEYLEAKKPWGIPADLAFPCATQNEIDINDAKALVSNGCKGVFEGANMPSSNEAIHLYQKEKMWFGPAKAANAGGVAISALEMAQNSLGMQWDREHIDEKLKEIMGKIHKTCVQYGTKGDYVCYLTGANIGGFIKVADTMLAYGVN